MRAVSFNSAKQLLRRTLVVAGVGLTLAVSAVPAQAAKPTSPGGSHGHNGGGGGTGHKVG